MKVTVKNYDEYEAIKDCKYQQTFPCMNVEILDVVCTLGVDIKGKAAFEYVPLCKDCVGKGCKKYQSREDK